MTTEAQNVAYGDLVDSVDLADVKLVDCQFKIKPQIMDPDRSKWKFGYDCELTDTSYDEEAQIVSAWVEASAYAKSGKTHILNVKGRYLLVYRVNGTSDEETAARFTRNVGPISVYPYFRSLFADLCAQGGAHVPPLPIMKGARRPLKAWAAAEQREE